MCSSDLEERNLGELEHASVADEILAWLRQHRYAWGIRSVSEIRIQVSPTRFRVADVAILSISAPIEQIIQTPPVAVIEILSPEDRFSRYTERLEDYRRMGVKNIWVMDPARRKGFDCCTGNVIEVTGFTAVPIRIDLAAIFAAIDEDRAR